MPFPTSYVICKCGDPVPVPTLFPNADRMVECENEDCGLRFAFEDLPLKTGTLYHDNEDNRWKIADGSAHLRHEPEQPQFYSMSARRFVRQAERRLDRGRNRRGR